MSDNGMMDDAGDAITIPPGPRFRAAMIVAIVADAAEEDRDGRLKLEGRHGS